MGGCEMRIINFNASHVLDAWTEVIVKNDCETNIDYIKLCNGVLVTVTKDTVRIFDADDLEVPGSAVVFRNITTREKL